MKTIDQTKFSLFYSDGKRLTYGNCLVACVASILGVSIDEVPNIYVFYGLDDVRDGNVENHLWFGVMNSWMEKKHGKVMVRHNLNELTNQEFVVMRGLSMRGKPHTCIYQNLDGKLVPFFDPHPTRQFLSEEQYYYTISSVN